MKKNEVLEKVVQPEVDAILGDVRKILKKGKYNKDNIINNFSEHFPAHYSYYQGLIQGLWLVHKIENLDEYWNYFEEKLKSI